MVPVFSHLFKKISLKFSLIITAIMAMIFLLISQKNYYYPLTVSVEMKSETESLAEFFYSHDNNFTRDCRIMYPYTDTGQFAVVSSILPASDIHGLRIDPCKDTSRITIRRICFSANRDSLVIRGRNILGRFTLIGMKPVDSLTTDNLLVVQSTGKDPILVFKEDIQNILPLENSRKGTIHKIIFLAVLVLVWSILILWSNFVVQQLRQAFRRAWQFTVRVLQGIGGKYAAWLIGLILFKYFLVSAQMMSFNTNAIHDDALFIDMAYLLGSGQWLGDYSQFTLVRGIIYPMFILAGNLAGIPLPVAQYLLLVLSALVLVYAVSPLVKSKTWQILLFAAILFNPMNSVQPMTRVLREGIYTSLGILVFGAFIGLLINRHKSQGSLLRWSLLAGFVLFLFWNTREEGLLILPSILWFSAAGIFLVLKKQPRNLGSGTLPSQVIHPLKKAGFFILPFLFLAIGNGMIATVNYFRYGGFIVNEIKSGAFPKAYNALKKIADNENKLMVPVTRAMRQKAYEVSPAFQKLKPFLEDETNPFLDYGPGYPDEYKGGWFYWVLRGAASRAGYHQNLKQSQLYYQTLSDELNQAMSEGRLPSKKQTSLLIFSWDGRYTHPVLNKLKESLWFMGTFKGYDPYPLYFVNDPEKIDRFQNITLDKTTLSAHPEANLPLANQLKYAILKFIARITAWISVPLILVSLLSFLVSTLMLPMHYGGIEKWVSWIILTGLLMIILARNAMIAFLAVTSHNSINTHYLNFAYPFLLIFVVLAMFLAADLILKKLRKS